jgi:hypothetical protein
MGSKGRGQTHGHYKPPDLTNVILAFAGAQPSDAADAAKRLRLLTFVGSNPAAESSYLDGENLGDILDRCIFALGDKATADAMQKMPGNGMRLLLSLNPLTGIIVLRDGFKEKRTEWFGSDQTKSGPPFNPSVMVQRMMIIDANILSLAGALWRDTLKQAKVEISPEAPLRAMGVNETAASLPGDAAVHRGQSVKTEPDSTSQSYPTTESQNSQSVSARRTGRSTQIWSDISEELEPLQTSQTD